MLQDYERAVRESNIDDATLERYLAILSIRACGIAEDFLKHPADHSIEELEIAKEFLERCSE